MRAAEQIQFASLRDLSLVGSIGLFGIAILPATPRVLGCFMAHEIPRGERETVGTAWRLEDELQTELQDAGTMCRIGMKEVT
jgi:hypothetical protein